jgi:hypothetical protein
MPIWEWQSPREVVVRTVWGEALLGDHQPPLRLDPWWLVGLETVLGRRLQVRIQEPGDVESWQKKRPLHV